jgi:hypothetical protein
MGTIKPTNIILDHRTLRETHLIGETDDTYAIFNIVTTEHPEGIWSKSEHLLEHSTIGYSIIERYLNGINAEGNIHYPIFEYAEHKDGTDSCQCLVIGTDNACTDNLDIRIAIPVAGEGQTLLTSHVPPSALHALYSDLLTTPLLQLLLQHYQSPLLHRQ